VPQAAPFTSIVNSLKLMSLTPRTCSELKSFDYDAKTIEFVNCLPTKFNGDILFELLMCVIYWDILENCKVWTKSMTVMFGASCRLVTLRKCLDWALEQLNALDICLVRMIVVLCFNVLLHTIKLVGVAIIPSYQ